MPAGDLIALESPPWHPADDTLDKVSARSMEIVGHAPTVNGESLDARTQVKLARWQAALEKADTEERRAAVQAEIDKLLGVQGMSREERIAHLRAELAKLEG